MTKPFGAVESGIPAFRRWGYQLSDVGELVIICSLQAGPKVAGPKVLSASSLCTTDDTFTRSTSDFYYGRGVKWRYI